MGVAASCALALPAAAEVNGAGASFPALIYARWAAAYQKAPGATAVAYKATGSGDGVKQATARTVAFGGTDSPLTSEELLKRKLVQVPMLVGGIVPVVNIPGVADGRLQLGGELLADIMAGRVKTWNDARIAAVNPGLALPATAIRRIVRADKSGSSESLTRYLAGASATFATDVGVNQLPKWPGEVERAEGSDGVVKALKATPGAIAYIGYDRVQQDKLAGVKLRNASGNWVAASEAGFKAAIIESEVSKSGDDTAPLLDRPGAGSWPLTMTSFVLFDAEPPKAADAAPALRFLYWCYMHGDELTRNTGFAPLPVNLQSRLSARFKQVKAKDGKQLDYMAM